MKYFVNVIKNRKLPAFLTFVLIALVLNCGKRQSLKSTPGMDDKTGQTWMRVLLFDNIRTCTLTAETGLTVTDTASGYRVMLEDSEKTTAIRISGGNVIIGKKITSKNALIETHEPFVLSIEGQKYRGNLQIIVNDQGETFDVINELPLEAYLAGVIGAEMPCYWNIEALKAQTIASRTYALYIKGRFGVNRHWDVRKTQASQVYKGIDAEHFRTWDAISQTSGQVLMCEQDNQWKIFPAYYHSSSGGHTENSKNVFGDSYEPLQGVKSPYCKKVTKKHLFSWRPYRVSSEEVARLLFKRYPHIQHLGNIKALEVRKKSDYGNFSRITSVKVIGEQNQSTVLRGEDLRLAIDSSGNKIKSAAFTIRKDGNMFVFSDGRGYGHGVGMSQYGALAMAREHKTAEEILSFYYPGSKIKEYP